MNDSLRRSLSVWVEEGGAETARVCTCIRNANEMCAAQLEIA